MRCRAWLKTRFCKNKVTGIFCRVHCHLKSYQTFFYLLPEHVLLKISQFVQFAEPIQMFRSTCKLLHETVPRCHFNDSQEFWYFQSFFSKEYVSMREFKSAVKRYAMLSLQDQLLVTSIDKKTCSVRGIDDYEVRSEFLLYSK